MVNQQIFLPMIPDSAPIVINISQYDYDAPGYAGRLFFNLISNGTPYDMNGATAVFQGEKPDGTAFAYPGVVVNASVVRVNVRQQMTLVAGRVRCNLVLNNSEGQIGSFNVWLEVQESATAGSDPSQTDIPALVAQARQYADDAAQSAADAAAWSAHPPYIGANNDWFVYDTESAQYVDTEVEALGKGIVSIEKTSTSGLVDTYTITYTGGETSTFTVTNGEDGTDGNRWFRGVAISGKAINPTVYPTSGITDAIPNDFYLNPSEGAIYHCVTGGDASTATWSYDFTMTGGGGGGSIVGWTQIQGSTGATKIAEISIDGNVTDVYAPQGGGLLPYLYIDSEAGATVTVDQPDGTTITPTAAGSGHWECELTGGFGTYVIHSVLSGQGDATVSLNVDTVKEYHITDNHFDFTINVTAPNGSTIRITATDETYTATGTGLSQAFAVHQASTQYTIQVTMDGNTKSDTVTSAATTGQSTSVNFENQFGTVIVNVDNAFVTAGSTISCVNGGTSCTPKAAASTVTFRVPSTGTWTVSGEVGGTTYAENAAVTALSTPVTISLQTIQIATVTLHGAAGAVITYTDANGAQTQTLGSDGKKANVSIAIPNNPSIVFTDTTVAKDPDNLSNNYTKSVTITESTTDVYVMPDNALYWWGYKGDIEEITADNGWTAENGYTPSGVTAFNTNDIYLNGVNFQIYGFSSKNLVSYNKINVISKNTGTPAGLGNAWGVGAFAAKYILDNPTGLYWNTADASINLKTYSTPGTSYIVPYIVNSGRDMTIYALWYE